ncbi:MAG: GDSL-type esterase/lipase family protein [Pseudomonadota bacterium]
MKSKLKLILILSLTLNIATIMGLAYLVPKATQMMSVVEDFTGNYIERRRDAIEASNILRAEVLFLGDSITHEGIWHEYLPGFQVVNHAVSGDNTLDLLTRLKDELRLQPEKLFLMIGINDLNAGQTVEQITENYDKILDVIEESAPSADVFLQSVLPTNEEWFFEVAEQDIDSLNRHLRTEASIRGHTFIDLTDIFAGTDGRLRPELSNDGIHLAGDGYKLWSARVRETLR